MSVASHDFDRKSLSNSLGDGDATVQLIAAAGNRANAPVVRAGLPAASHPPVRIPAADGIRGIACLMVVLVHCTGMMLPATAPFLSGTGKIGVWLWRWAARFWWAGCHLRCARCRCCGCGNGRGDGCGPCCLGKSCRAVAVVVILMRR
jgi:hypothetical protein